MKKTRTSFALLIIAFVACSTLYAKGVDPTRPPSDLLNPGEAASEKIHSPKRLTAIFQYPDQNIAVIDNQIVKQGDHLGEYVVTIIKKNEVELTGLNNKRIMLKLSPTVKQLR